MKLMALTLSPPTTGLTGWLLLFCFLLPAALSAQLDNLVTGSTQSVYYTGSYQDFLIPQQSTYRMIRFTLRGGDGGWAKVSDSSPSKTKYCTANGGGGASADVLFELGSGTGQLQPGATIRFVVGGAGEAKELSSVVGGAVAGGGGGGSAILYQVKGSEKWTILAVAGGGGGAYQGVAFGSCQDGHDGGNGRTVSSGGGGQGSYSGSGGSNGSGGKGGGGIGDRDLAGGGGGALSDGKGGSSMEGKAGGSAGGSGGNNAKDGGYGFGGGGAADEAGGGGGGYSGGGGGGMTGNGGGGGSYVNTSLAIEQMILETSVSGWTKRDGVITYKFTNYGLSQALLSIHAAAASSIPKKDLHARWVSSNTPTDLALQLWDYSGSSPTFNERWYYEEYTSSLRLFKDPDKCLDVADPNTTDAAVYLRKCDGRSSQQWTFANNFAQLKNLPGKCLGLRSGDFENGNLTQLQDCDDADTGQQWYLESFKYTGLTETDNNYDWYRYDLSSSIRLAKNSNKCMVAEDADASGDTNAELNDCRKDPAQQWLFEDARIKLAVNPSKCLELYKNYTANGTNVQLYSCNSSPGQKWIYDVYRKIIRSGNDFNKCIDLVNGITTSGTNVQVWDCVSDIHQSNQQWVVDGIPSKMPTGTNKRIYLEKDNGKCVDIAAAGTANGTNVQLYHCHSTNSQYLVFDNRYLRMQANTGKCLSLQDSGDANGNNIHLWDCKGQDNQKWVYDGFAKAFRSVVNINKCLSIKDADAHDGTNIHLWDCKNSENQRFDLY